MCPNWSKHDFPKNAKQVRFPWCCHGVHECSHQNRSPLIITGQRRSARKYQGKRGRGGPEVDSTEKHGDSTVIKEIQRGSFAPREHGAHRS